jgi:hypothetical protein
LSPEESVVHEKDKHKKSRGGQKSWVMKQKCKFVVAMDGYQNFLNSYKLSNEVNESKFCDRHSITVEGGFWDNIVGVIHIVDTKGTAVVRFTNF